MTEYVTIPLDIEGVKVDRVEVTENGEVHIHVSSTVDGTGATGVAGTSTTVMTKAGRSSSGICRSWTGPRIS